MSRRPLILAAIVLAGIGVRFAYTATVGHATAVTSIEGQLAHNIVADGRWFLYNTRVEAYLSELVAQRHRLIDPASIDYRRVDERSGWHPEIGQSVGTSVVIAALWAITGDERYVQLQILQGIVDGLVALLVYWIAMQLFARRLPALIAAALYALFPPLAWQTANAYNDLWAVDFTVAIFALYLIALRAEHRWRWLILCGLCVGVGAYFRPQVAIVVPALALVTLSTAGWRVTLLRIAVPCIVAALVILPWTIRNYDDFHMFVPMRSALWATALEGLGEIPNDFGANYSEAAITATVHRVRPDLIPESPAWDAFIKHYAVRAIEQHPLFYLEVLAHRVAMATVLMNETTWMSGGAGHLSSSARGIVSSIVNHPLIVLEEALEPFAFLAAMIGLALTWRYRTREQALLIALVASVLLPYIAVHVEPRYLLPAFPAYFIWIGLGADRLYLHTRARIHRYRDDKPARAVQVAALSGGSTPRSLQV
jgi:4-amino-4-deoxy-L-arabinose transferase-like glycosyltransferase